MGHPSKAFPSDSDIGLAFYNMLRNPKESRAHADQAVEWATAKAEADEAEAQARARKGEAEDRIERASLAEAALDKRSLEIGKWQADVARKEAACKEREDAVKLREETAKADEARLIAREQDYEAQLAEKLRAFVASR